MKGKRKAEEKELDETPSKKAKVEEKEQKQTKKLFIENGRSWQSAKKKVSQMKEFFAKQDVEIVLVENPRKVAFEVTNESGEVLHSKIETKRYPTIEKFKEILEKL
jgi:hypothetical protein